MKDTWKAERRKWVNRNRWTGGWHIVNTETQESLESHLGQKTAEYFCKAANEHEVLHGRRPLYAVGYDADIDPLSDYYKGGAA